MTGTTKTKITYTQLVRGLMHGLLLILLGGAMSGCASTNAWKEEVKLSDGRIIIVTQKRRYDGGVSTLQGANTLVREAWLTLRLPEFGDQDIAWHENLEPQVLNVFDGKLYIVGIPPTGLEFDQYGKPNPAYIGYRYENGSWVRIPFEKIPEAIYDTNLLIATAPPNKSGHVTLADKEKEMRDAEYSKHYKRIDPKEI